MHYQNHYEFLNISIDADDKTILKAIAQIEKNDHNRQYANRLITIKHTLTDPNRRRAYDRLIQQTPAEKTLSDLNDYRLGNNPSLTRKETNKDSPNDASNNFIRVIEASSDSEREQAANEPIDFTSAQTTPLYYKDRLTAAWLSFFSAGFGIHRFWLGQTKLGLLYLFINAMTSGLLSIAGMVEGVVLFLSSDMNWQRQHGDKASNYPGKDKIAAALLAFFGGFIGAHRYYLGQWKVGIFYTLFFWTLIPLIIAIIEGISYLQQSDDDWNGRYAQLKNNPAGCFSVLFIPIIVSIIMVAFMFIITKMMSD